MKRKFTLLLAVLLVLFAFGACEPSSGEKKVKLSFDTDGKVFISSQSVPFGEIHEMPETPQVEGYVFAGWYFDEEFENRYFFDYALESNTTLYAKFYDLTLGEYNVISNVEQLTAIKDAPEAKYLLACDINCKGNTLDPIATFSGELDGNGYKLFNYLINKETDLVAFISTNNGTVKNLSFSDFVFTVSIDSSTNKNYAMVCGINNGTIENCNVLDGALKIKYSTGKKAGNNSGASYFLTAIGGIVGNNKGIVKK